MLYEDIAVFKGTFDVDLSGFFNAGEHAKRIIFDTHLSRNYEIMHNFHISDSVVNFVLTLS